VTSFGQTEQDADPHLTRWVSWRSHSKKFVSGSDTITLYRTYVSVCQTKGANMRVTDQDIYDLIDRIQELMDNTVNKGRPESSYRQKVRVRNDKINPKAKYIALDSYSLHPDGVSESAGGVFCFVAAVDNQSKAVGVVQKGDILKSGGYSTPAKHARGNIYDENQGMRGMAWTGPHYLK